MDLGLGKNKKNTFQISKFPLVLHVKPLVREQGQVELGQVELEQVELGQVEMSTYIYMSTYTQNCIYTYRDRIRDFKNTSTYPECRDTQCQDNEWRLYLTYTKHLFYLQSNKYYVYFNFWIQQKERYITVSISHNIKHNIQCQLSGLLIKFIRHE